MGKLLPCTLPPGTCTYTSTYHTSIMMIKPMHLFLVDQPSLSVSMARSQPDDFKRLINAYVTKGLEIRMGSSRERNSTVPMAEDGSIGVKTKWFLGETHTTSYLSVSTTCKQRKLDTCCSRLAVDVTVLKQARQQSHCLQSTEQSSMCRNRCRVFSGMLSDD